jgi:sarcosine oxidase
MPERDVGVDRRTFLKAATAGAGMSIAGFSPASGEIHSPRPLNDGSQRPSQAAPDIVVVGAGNFGMWTAFYLTRLGANVTVVDKYGPANSRSTSGGETRGVRSSYGGQATGLLWNRWANEAIKRWTLWDEEWSQQLLPKLFFNTGDLIARPRMGSYLESTMADWDTLGVPYELLTPEEIRYRWPVIGQSGVGVGLYEPAAGVVRARRAIEGVAEVFRKEGGEVTIAAAEMGAREGRQLNALNLQPGETISAATYVFACGPWFPKVFPDLMGKRLRISMGHTFYFATPPGDNSYSFPNLPSYGFPGVTGWPALPRDHRGFRVRTGGRGAEDPDVSDRWIPEQYHDRPKQVLADHFPGLVGQPINETRACHYESSVSRNFIVDKHPDFDNVWLAGGGSAESFKQGPVLGEYIARRIMDVDDEPELAEGFRLSEDEFG